MVAQGIPNTEKTLLKRALAVAGVNNVAPASVNPDKYMESIMSLKPPDESTPLVPMHCVEVPESFRTSLLLAINNLKNKKSPRQGKIRTDVFTRTPGLLGDTVLALWRAVGRTAHMPALLRDGIIVPIYKQKGDPALSTNRQPVCPTSAFRRLIGTSLTHDLTQVYQSSLPNQWEFQ